MLSGYVYSLDHESYFQVAIYSCVHVVFFGSLFFFRGRGGENRNGQGIYGRVCAEYAS